MIPKVNWRKIGAVNIIQLNGVFVDPWVKRGQEQMSAILEEHPTRGLLLNLRELEKVDRTGAEALLETTRKPAKGAILGQNLSVSFITEHMAPGERVPIFETQGQAVEYFGQEFALAGSGPRGEKRRFPRILTALAAEFEIKSLEEPRLFEVVVTNLSEGGLYGLFLDSDSEELAQRTLDPFNLKMLEMRLKLAENEVLAIEGKMVRAEEDASSKALGVAIEFYHLKPEDQSRILTFLKREGEEGTEGEER